MDLDYRQHRFALSIMAAITVLNIVLAINFLGASGRALAAAFNSQTIFLLAGFELIAVLATYVVIKHRHMRMPPHTGATVARG